MSTTDAGRLNASGKPDIINRDGVSLQAVLESARRLDELSCARVVGNIAEAVHAAQRAGQPLAALTPSAIVVQADGGVAFAAAPASPRYLAPEKLRGGPGDRRSDVFALGVMLWEALAHDRLFGGDDDDAVRRAVAEAVVHPPSELNANVPAELDAICKRALARDPAERYQSAKVMAADIDAVLGDAGYPESNEQIAAFVAAMTPPPAKPMAVVAPRPALQPSATLPLPVVEAAAATQPSMPAMLQTTQPLPAIQPPATRPPTAPPVTPQASAPPAVKPRPASQPPILPRAATQPPVIQPPAPPSPAPDVASLATARTAPVPSISMGSSRDTLPPPFVPRQGAPTAILGSLSPTALPPPAAAVEAPVRPGSPARSTTTELLGSLPPAAAKPPAVTAFLGSSASAEPSAAGPPPGPSAPPAPIAQALGPAPEAPPPAPPVVAEPIAPAPVRASPFAAVMPAALASFAPEAPTPAPSFGPPAMPEPIAAIIVPSGAALHSPVASDEPDAPELGMPPGMTIAPGSPAAPLRTADSDLEDDDDDEGGDFGAERHVDPAAVVALQRADRTTGGRDVLAGWGWSTGSMQAIADEDDFPDTARASRRRLVIAIGGALGVVAVVVIAALAFSGSKQPEPDSHAAAPPTPTAVAAAPTTGSAAPAAAPTTGSAAPAAPTEGSPPPTAPAAGSTGPTVVASTDPAAPAAEPAAAAAIEPTQPPPPSPAPSPPAGSAAVPVAAPPATAAPAPAPATAAVEPPPPTKPAKPAVEPPPPAPAKPARVAVEPPRKADKPEAKKPAPRPPSDRPARHPPERTARTTARAQPIDPYATPAEPPKFDAAAAYKTGIQQYARGDTAGALATFRTSLSSNPDFAPTWRGLGVVYEKLGNKAQARSAFQRYLRLAPEAPDVDQIRERLDRLGLLLIMRGRLIAALAVVAPRLTAADGHKLLVLQLASCNNCR